MSKIIRMNDLVGKKTSLDRNIGTHAGGFIKLFNVVKCFDSGKMNGRGKKERFTALNHISLSIDMKRIAVIKGTSGSGKTTLLSIIGCMSRPTSGRIYIDGREITSLPERFLSRIRRERFGFVFQNYNLIKGIGALENIMLPAFPTNKKPKLIRQRAMELLEKLKILSKAGEKVEHLSGGELQRVAIARALINDPDIVIADEPTAHLNTDLAMKFLDIVFELREEGKTILIASHDPLLFESNGIHRVVEMRDGRIIGTEYRSGNKAVGEADTSGSMSIHRTKPTPLGYAGRIGNKRRNGDDRRLAKDRRLKRNVGLKKKRPAGIDRRAGWEKKLSN